MPENDPILAAIQDQLRALRMKEGTTSLMFACLEFDEEALEHELSAGDVNAVNKQNRTALHEVVRNSYKNEEAGLRIIKRLIDSGANPNVQDKLDKFSPAMEAGIYGFNRVLQLLIESGADLNLRDKQKKTVLGLIEDTPSLRTKRRKLVKMVEAAGGVR